MKPAPTHDFPLNVRERIWEAPPSTSRLYAGIYEVVLNFTATVTFVPPIGRSAAETVTLPAEFDDITTAAEARLVSLATTQYAVTPDDRRAGGDEVATWIDWGDPALQSAPIVFYVTDEAFRVYQAELAGLSELFSGIFDAVRVSTLKDKAVVRFLLDRVIASPRFAPKDRQMLGR